MASETFQGRIGKDKKKERLVLDLIDGMLMFDYRKRKNVYELLESPVFKRFRYKPDRTANYFDAGLKQMLEQIWKKNFDKDVDLKKIKKFCHFGDHKTKKC